MIVIRNDNLWVKMSNVKLVDYTYEQYVRGMYVVIPELRSFLQMLRKL